ncbi:acetyl-CoA carboxylase biotin carboxylase subunit [Methylocapsa palsarum]|uniref:propionyl-CoA carboxylase n=1 Tax=Methylocapsa palsarum TaxID=1612308 RepID=A0A1I3XXI2_9HYPH|nr:acetyl/propionyl/methylcrotonyl-CoA carboxylase subunit alpha [Methylocapsa palsarum]SFK23771.1 propionyl-CoA carboxylase alpha chain [Methylocapsa palsarum]
MFQKILIANRGEIACRVISTARRMGLATVAVYSEADTSALHVTMAHEAIAIGPAPAAQSYLDIGQIIAACKACGAEAVHPGYGFLSERADFARALEATGIVLIGPNPTAIEAMGDKIQSKKFAQAAGVSTVPGSPGVVEDLDDAIKIAALIGYPVMIKASAGGGGKGMRVAAAESELAEGLARARSEGKSSFGDDRVFIEKFITDPRHIEIQVLGDKYGAIIHLGERECSIQRRNQKVIEEAPSPFIDEATRREMGAQAVALAKAVQYDSAGTVEFVVGQDRSFYFLEMNTRLQVEHPVTELVTGIDLVEQMIRIAAGEKLRIRQEDVHLRGAAIESRIYAEDPTRNFLPSTGRLTTYRPPAAGRIDGADVRIDAGVVEGDEISIHYDPMIAKLVTHSGDRPAAIEAQSRALNQFVIEGVRHNIFFLADVMERPRWKTARLSTAFIEQEYPRGFAGRDLAPETARRLAAVAASIDHTMNERKRLISGQIRAGSRFRFERERCVLLDGAPFGVRLEEGDGGLLVCFKESAHALLCASNWVPGQKVWSGDIDGDKISVQVRTIPNGHILAHGGAVVEAHVYTRREAELFALMPRKRTADVAKALLCPMPGVLKAVYVAPGQPVKAGEALCVVEAMKMENVLRADEDASVKTIVATEGDTLACDAPIMTFE